MVFPLWEATLAASSISPDRRWRFATEISRFLRYCQILDAPVTKPRAREYLAKVPLVSARPLAREALHWFFAAASGGKIPLQTLPPGPLPARRRCRQELPMAENSRDHAVAPRVGWISSR